MVTEGDGDVEKVKKCGGNKQDFFKSLDQGHFGFRVLGNGGCTENTEVTSPVQSSASKKEAVINFSDTAEWC